MDELRNVPQAEELNCLYSLLRRDPYFLQAFDTQPFADTPLHLAASEGRTQLALEVQRLLPSLGRKLNPDGLSPLHLALRKGHANTAKAMIKMDPQLPGVQGREGFTPLHFAVERDGFDYLDVLVSFLMICPDSIKYLTIREESVLHVAVKRENLKATKVLLGWLERKGKTDVVRWKDWEGNTALHIATLTNQRQIIKQLVLSLHSLSLKATIENMNDKNLKGETALDMAKQLPSPVREDVSRILRRFCARSSSTRPNSRVDRTLVDYLSEPTTHVDLGLKIAAYMTSLQKSTEIRDAIIVVAILIATATFQAALSPPGGFSNPTPNGNATSTVGDGKVVMPNSYFLAFTTFNTIALAGSLGTIFLLIPNFRISAFLHVSILFMMVSYVLAIRVTSPPSTAKAATYIAGGICLVFGYSVNSLKLGTALSWTGDPLQLKIYS